MCTCKRTYSCTYTFFHFFDMYCLESKSKTAKYMRKQPQMHVESNPNDTNENAVSPHRVPINIVSQMSSINAMNLMNAMYLHLNAYKSFTSRTQTLTKDDPKAAFKGVCK